MSTKIEMRAGDVEFVFESDQPISVEDAKQFLSQIHEIAKTLGYTSAKKVDLGRAGNQEDINPEQPGANESLNLHVNSIAERLGAKSGAEVAMAAAAYLQLVEGKDSFSRKDLLSKMKDAKNYYTQNMSSNLTTILKGLTGSQLNQLANDHYSIKAPELGFVDKGYPELD